jgi:hypothetical protein
MMELYERDEFRQDFVRFMLEFIASDAFEATLDLETFSSAQKDVVMDSLFLAYVAGRTNNETK